MCLTEISYGLNYGEKDYKFALPADAKFIPVVRTPVFIMDPMKDSIINPKTWAMPPSILSTTLV